MPNYIENAQNSLVVSLKFRHKKSRRGLVGLVFFITVFCLLKGPLEGERNLCIDMGLKGENLSKYCIAAFSRHKDFNTVRVTNLAADAVLFSNSFEIRNSKFTSVELTSDALWKIDKDACQIAFDRSKSLAQIQFADKKGLCWGLDLSHFTANYLLESSILRAHIFLKKQPDEMILIPRLFLKEEVQISRVDSDSWNHFSSEIFDWPQFGDRIYENGIYSFTVGESKPEGIEIQKYGSIFHGKGVWPGLHKSLTFLYSAHDIQMNGVVPDRGAIVAAKRYETEHETILQVDFLLKKNRTRHSVLLFEHSGSINPIEISKMTIDTPTQLLFDKEIFLLGPKRYDEFVGSFSDSTLRQVLIKLAKPSQVVDFFSHPELAKWEI